MTIRPRGHRKEITCAACDKLICKRADNYHDESTWKAERYYHDGCCPVCNDSSEDDAWTYADIEYDRSRNT